MLSSKHRWIPNLAFSSNPRWIREKSLFKTSMNQGFAPLPPRKRQPLKIDRFPYIKIEKNAHGAGPREGTKSQIHRGSDESKKTCFF